VPNYDFKCKECKKLEERNVLWKERDNQICGCGGKMNMQIDFSGVQIIGVNRFMRKKGIDAKQDRYYANKSLEEKGKLPKEIVPEKGIVDGL